MRNDAVGALAALRKGCSSSSFLQQCLMRFACLQHAARCNTLYLHAPGTVLIEEGVDDLSRETAADVAGPVSGTLVRSHALRLGLTRLEAHSRRFRLRGQLAPAPVLRPLR